MFENYQGISPFLNIDLEEESEMDFYEESVEDIDEFDPEELEQELREAEQELALSQAQGSWLDGYLDAVEEWEDEEDDE